MIYDKNGKPIKSSNINLNEDTKKLIDKLEKKVGHKLKIEFLDRRENDIPYVTVEKILPNGKLGVTDGYLNRLSEDLLFDGYSYGNDVNEYRVFLDPAIMYTKPLKSSADTLPSEVYYIIINGAKQYFSDKNKAEETAAELGVGSVYTETDPEEIQELIDVGYIHNSRIIKSAENYGWIVDSSDAPKALNMWTDYVGEDNALEDIAKAMSDDTLDENIEWVARQWGFGEDVEDLDTAWEKYELAKEVMGVHDLFENLTQAAGYDELAEDLAFIFRQNDFRQWDEENENDIYSSKKKAKTADERAKDEGADITCSRKSIKSSEDSINGLSPRQYRNAIDKASEMIANGERDVQKICKATKLDEGDVNAMIADQDEFEESVNSSRKAIKSGWTFRSAVDTFKSEYGRFNDYWEMQQAWEAFKDGLARDGEITQKQFDNWGNPCTPETFNRWNGPAPEDEFEDDIYSSRKAIKSSVEPGDTVYFWLSDDAKEKYLATDEDGNPAGDWEEGERIMEILDDNFQPVYADVISSPEDGPYADEFLPSGIYMTTPRELKDFFDKGLLDKSIIEVGLGYEETEGDYGDPWYKLKDIINIDSIINFKD